MDVERPHLIVLAGPNGAGKSTAARSVLVGALGVAEFVNADMIAQGISAFHPEQAAFEAGYIMLQRLRQLAEKRANFAFETTLASRSFAPWVAGLRKSGYIFHLVYLWLPSPEMAMARVLDRVRQGGHNVPPETIRRRYSAGLRNFFALYQPLADRWRMYDNSDWSGPRLLATGRGLVEELVLDENTWQRIRKRLSDE